MTPEEQSNAHYPHLSPARARLCALTPRLSEHEVEALLGIAELFVRGRNAPLATAAPAPRLAPTEPSAPAVPACPRSTSSRPPIEDAPYTLTVPEAARLLGLATSTMWNHVASGRIPVVRLGHRTLISRATIERLLAESGPQDTGDRPAHSLTRAAPRGGGKVR